MLSFYLPFSSASNELELIQTQMKQKPMLRAEGECACVAQLACAKIRGPGWPNPSQRARHLWLVRTLKMHRRRRLTCGIRSSISAEVNNGLSTHKAFVLCPRAKAPTELELLPQPHSGSETRAPPKSDIMPVGRLWLRRLSQSKS